MKTYIAVVLLYILLIFVLLYGWVMNIITIVNFDFINGVTGVFIVRVAGIFLAPLGGVLGYF